MGKYLKERERYQIEILKKQGLKPKEIATAIGKSVRTIYYELARGTVEMIDTELIKRLEYCADTAQDKYNKNKRNKGKDLKIGNDFKLVFFIEKWIGEQKYSPYAVLQKIKNENLTFNTSICIKTLYNYIDNNLFLNISNKDLIVKCNKKKQTHKQVGKCKVALNNIKGTSIEERPKKVLDRAKYGDWELDTVVGGQGKGKSCLLVFSERMTREEIIVKVPDKKDASVVKAIDQIERKLGAPKFKDIFNTITCDNGVEFLDFKNMEKSAMNKGDRTKIYYCHPYCPSERGTNENLNKMIRRFIPKGANIDLIEKKQIIYIQNWMNEYPRKILKGMSVNMYKKKLGIV